MEYDVQDGFEERNAVSPPSRFAGIVAENQQNIVSKRRITAPNSRHHRPTCFWRDRALCV